LAKFAIVKNRKKESAIYYRFSEFKVRTILNMIIKALKKNTPDKKSPILVINSQLEDPLKPIIPNTMRTVIIIKPVSNNFKNESRRFSTRHILSRVTTITIIYARMLISGKKNATEERLVIPDDIKIILIIKLGLLNLSRKSA
jgi:hypothetical protein